MKRYLTPRQNPSSAETVRRVLIESPVGVYRRDGRDNEVVVETDRRTIDLGITDSAVSRKKGDEWPIEIAPDERGLSIHNRGSSNPIQVLQPEQLAIGEGETVVVTGDCTILVGITAELRATVVGQRDTFTGSELEEKLNFQRDGEKMEGVSPASHARMTATALRKASDESILECRKVLTEMRNFVAEYPVDDPDYEQVKERVEESIEWIEWSEEVRSDSDFYVGGELDEKGKMELDLVAERVEGMYARNG